MEAAFAFAGAFGLVFLAELGDRTQIVLFALATRHPRAPLFVGASAAFLVQTLLAVLVGETLGTLLATRLVFVVGAFLFLGMGGIALVGALRYDAEEEEAQANGSARGAFFTAFLFVLVAEFADKTQIAAAALAAASRAPVATFFGAFLALLANAALALLVGRFVAERLAARTVRMLAAAAFLLAGAILLVVALL